MKSYQFLGLLLATLGAGNNIFGFKITLKPLDHPGHFLEIEGTETVSTLKEKISNTLKASTTLENKTRYTKDRLSLIFCGETLKDDKTVQNYKLIDGSIIHIVLKCYPRDPILYPIENTHNVITAFKILGSCAVAGLTALGLYYRPRFTLYGIAAVLGGACLWKFGIKKSFFARTPHAEQAMR